jgi:UDP-glucose 4-epimerase
MNILVTGGAGFIGSHIVDRLIKEGHSVAVIDDLSNGRLDNLAGVKDRIRFYKMSVTSQDLAEVFTKERPEVVFHLAAHINVRNSMKDPTHDATVNILGSINVLEHARLFGTKKIIFSSTGGAIYGETDNIPTPETEEARPICHYGASKYSVEHYIFLYKAIYGLDYTILRYANVYGPRQDPIGEAGVVAIFTSSILAGKDCRINGDGGQTRDYVFVGDVVEANLLALAKGSGMTCNIATGKETDVNALQAMIASSVKEKTGKATKSFHGPAIPGEVLRSCLDASLAGKTLGWKPKMALADGIKETVSWFVQKK